MGLSFGLDLCRDMVALRQERRPQIDTRDESLSLELAGARAGIKARSINVPAGMRPTKLIRAATECARRGRTIESTTSCLKQCGTHSPCDTGGRGADGQQVCARYHSQRHPMMLDQKQPRTGPEGGEGGSVRTQMNPNNQHRNCLQAPIRHNGSDRLAAGLAGTGTRGRGRHGCGASRWRAPCGSGAGH